MQEALAALSCLRTTSAHAAMSALLPRSARLPSGMSPLMARRVSVLHHVVGGAVGALQRLAAS